MKQSVNATLIKLGGTGVGIARINPEAEQGGSFVYFKPRDLVGYRGETWLELAARGLTPGQALQIDVDSDPSGEIHQVSGVRFASR